MRILKIIFKNTFRHKLRTGLTILSIAIAILAFGMIRSIVDTVYTGIDRASAKRLFVRNAISMAFPLPLSYEEKIRQIDGVKLLTSFTWFGGMYRDEKTFFPNFAVEPRALPELYPENIVPPDQIEAFLKDRRAALAGRKLAERFGWKVGDPITLKGTIYPGNWDFVLRAIYKGKDQDTDERLFFFHWDYLNETMKREAPDRADLVGSFSVGISDSVNPADVAANIDKVFENSRAETLTESEKAFTLHMIAMVDAIIVVIRLVAYIVIIIIIAVAANTMSMTTRERIGEFSIFKTLGFGPFWISSLIFGESFIISFAGCFLGIILTFPAAKIFKDLTSAFVPYFEVKTITIWLDLAWAVVIGIIAGLVPTWRAIRIKVADGLRRIG